MVSVERPPGRDLFSVLYRAASARRGARMTRRLPQQSAAFIRLPNGRISGQYALPGI